MSAAVLGKRSDGCVAIPAAAATVVSPGDMTYRSTSTGKAHPLSDQVDQTSEELNQRLARKTFLGHARTGKTSSEAEKDILVDTSLETEYAVTCVSETHEIGDLLGPDEAASGTALENQKLVKVSNVGMATHVCVKRDASAATTVRCRMLVSIAQPTVASGKELLKLGHFQWAAIADGDLRTAMPLPFKGAIISLFAMVDEPIVGAGGTVAVNAEIGTTDLTGGVVTVSTAVGGTRGAKIDGTAITAANAFVEGDTLSIEASAAGGTRTSGTFDLWAVLERRPG